MLSLYASGAFNKLIKVPLRRNFTFLFPTFFKTIKYDVLSSKKKKVKRLPSLKFRRSKSEIFRPPLLEVGSS